jgi:hypothetical protein
MCIRNMEERGKKYGKGIKYGQFRKIYTGSWMRKENSPTFVGKCTENVCKLGKYGEVENKYWIKAKNVGSGEKILIKGENKGSRVADTHNLEKTFCAV